MTRSPKNEKPKVIRTDDSVVTVRRADRHVSGRAGVDVGIETLYSVEVDEILRGYVGYVKSRRSGIGWRTYCLLPRPTHYGSSIAGHVSSVSVPGSSVDEIARSFPEFVRRGRFPSLPEVAAILAEADAKNEKDEAERRAARLRIQADEEEAEATRLQAIEVLEAMRDRLSTILTNSETSALVDAVSILRRGREK